MGCYGLAFDFHKHWSVVCVGFIFVCLDKRVYFNNLVKLLKGNECL